MLRQTLNHPQILEAVARAGHGSKILITDGNYPAATKLGQRARLVHLNLAPGLVSATQVLEVLAASVPIEAAVVMDYARTGPYALTQDPPIWDEFRGIFAAHKVEAPLQTVGRFTFYEMGSENDVALTIQTGEQRIYANLLLTIGVVMPT